MARKKIGALLEDKGYINEFQLVAALSHQRKWKTKLGQSLIELGYLEEEQLFEVLAEQLGMEFVKLRKVEPEAAQSERGATRWRLTVPAGGKAAISLAYSIEYPLAMAAQVEAEPAMSRNLEWLQKK